MQEIKELIQKEIDWCNANQNTDNKDYENGFIKGLEQALLLIGKYESSE